MKQQADVCSSAFTPEQGEKCNARNALLAFSLAILNFLVSEEHLQFMRTVCAAQNTELALTDFYRQGPQNTLERLIQWLGALASKGDIRCPQADRSAELFLGMLLRMDLVRALYGVLPRYTDAELKSHAEFVVDTFLALHS
jgi:TetR/AcrR family transcriptional repressor of mexJK operon